MTGGQYSPMSGAGTLATTAPYGNIDRDFDAVKLAEGAGATFVARSTTYHVKELCSLLKKAILHKGFSVVEVMTQCPTYFGRKNRLGDAADMLRHYRDHTAPLDSPRLGENPGLIPRGIFVNREEPEYCESYEAIIRRVKE